VKDLNRLTQFTDLGLDKALIKALAEKGYASPTPIQAQAIPGVMAGRDLLGVAQTGTGKTAAFALPILHRLAADRKAAPRRGCRCLVLAPTRELATQIGESFKTYGRHLGMSTAVIFGGVKYGAQIKALAAGIDVLVATPGRLLDHIQEKMAVRNAQPGRRYPLSLSIGIVPGDSAQSQDLEQLLHQADALMYRHKQDRRLTRSVR